MKAKQFLVDYSLLTLGTALVAMGTYFFKFPNQFSTGGVTGIAVILSSMFPAISSSLFASVINVLFLFLGFLFLNRGFGVRTIYCSLLFSGMLAGLEWLVPLSGTLTDEKLLELFFGVILPALGSAILFNTQGSTGGTDILAMILKKFTSLDIGMALLYVDVLIAASTLVLIDVETGLFSLLGLVLKSVLVDSVIESLNRKKSFILVTSCPICYKTFKEDYTLKIKIMHHTEYIDMLLREGKLPLHKNDLKTVFHNPCELGRGCGVVDAPNHVLEQVSQRIPTRYDGKNSLCCGGSLANTVIDSQQKTKISTDTVKAYSAYQPDVIVTACPLCKKTLGKTSTSVPVKDIAEIVAAS